MKQFLLDTQIALWLFTGDKKLDREKFFERFTPSENEFIFHQTSTWEIQIKYQTGKLKLPIKPEVFLPKLIKDSGLNYSKIEDKAIFFLDRLPLVHRDPFDRLLIAHAMTNAWTIISSDSKFLEYSVLLETI